MQVLLTLVIGAILLGGCAAKEKAVSAQASETTATTGKPLASDPPKMARESTAGLPASEDYERAVADYNKCILDHTADLGACEKQRAIMNADGKALPRPSPSQSNKIINMER